MSRKTIPSYNPESRDPDSATERSEERNDQRAASVDDKVSNTSTNKEPGKQFGEVQGFGRAYDYAANLPMEFYHYYYGSNTDMGTLIEVIVVIFLRFSLIAESCGIAHEMHAVGAYFDVLSKGEFGSRCFSLFLPEHFSEERYSLISFWET